MRAQWLDRHEGQTPPRQAAIDLWLGTSDNRSHAFPKLAGVRQLKTRISTNHCCPDQKNFELTLYIRKAMRRRCSVCSTELDYQAVVSCD